VLRKLAAVAALLLVTATATAGCSLNMLGAPTGHLTLTARFDDVQDLGPGHTVQIANVRVGSVTKVALDHYRAKVTLSIKDGHPIPVGTSARVRRTSVLGEPYVDLSFPKDVDAVHAEHLRDGDEITRTSTDPSVEQLAGRAGQLVAAIDPNDLASSIQASAEALAGNGPELHKLVAQLSTLLSGIDAQHDDIAATIDNLGALGRTLAPLDTQIGSLLDSTAKTTTALGSDTDKLVGALHSFDDVAATTNRTILEPHADELAALLREASAVVGSLSQNQHVLASMADSFAKFVPRITRTIVSGQLLVFTWIDVNITIEGQPLMAALPASVATLVDGRP
jgi:phospholipid/cholesterol/gamma-HCH transport system substrate-binding protein